MAVRKQPFSTLFIRFSLMEWGSGGSPVHRPGVRAPPRFVPPPGGEGIWEGKSKERAIRAQEGRYAGISGGWEQKGRSGGRVRRVAERDMRRRHVPFSNRWRPGTAERFVTENICRPDQVFRLAGFTPSPEINAAIHLRLLRCRDEVSLRSTPGALSI